MLKGKSSCRSNCPINFALETFGDQWTLLIIRDLMFLGKRQYGDFLESGEGISTNILADRLTRLEKSEMITRFQDPANKTKFIYQLTQKGLDLLPTLMELAAWSAKYDPNTAAPPQEIRRMKRDREGYMKETLSNIKKGQPQVKP